MPIKTKLKVNDEVIVITGKNRKARGKIMKINRGKGVAFVQGVNMRKRFLRPSQENPKGGIVEMEAPIHLSNIMYYDSKSKTGVRIKSGLDKDGRKSRISSKSGKELD